MKERNTKSRFGDLHPGVERKVDDTDGDELANAHVYSGVNSDTLNTRVFSGHWRSGYLGCGGVIAGFTAGYFGVSALQQKYHFVSHSLELPSQAAAGLIVAITLGYIASHSVRDSDTH